MPDTPTSQPTDVEALCEQLEDRSKTWNRASFGSFEHLSYYGARDAELDDKAATLIRQQQAEIERQGWAPIDTAPRDGTIIDLWVEYRDARGEVEHHRKAACRWRNGWRCGPVVEFAHPNGAYQRATHWMLPPGPPATTARDALSQEPGHG